MPGVIISSLPEDYMQIGMVGLGRMGMNMARRLLKDGHEVVAYNRSRDKVNEIEKEGARGASSVPELVKALEPRRVVWLMLPAGETVEEHVKILAGLLEKNDVLVEGGNSYYKDDIRRAKDLEPLGIRFVDAGVSGGIWGLRNGYCTMIGGDKADFAHIEPLLKSLAPENGYLHCGKTGAGHFVKMVHNGIEYALMQAYGEGFELLKESPYGAELGFKDVAHLWNQGSVVRSWLLELLESAFEKDARLDEIRGYVEDSGEGRWTVLQAVESGVSATSIAHSLFRRFDSRKEDTFSNKILAALRNEFGGHAVQKNTVKKK
jgi:6-phosphogluconate dehydrogenase